MNISEQVRGVIAEALCIHPDQLTDDTRIDAIPDFDSLAMFDVVFALEKKFDVRVVDSSPTEYEWKLEDFHTVGDIVHALERTLQRVH